MSDGVKRKRHRVSLHDRWVLLGASGSGKTTFGKRLLVSLADAYPKAPIYILDTKQQGDFTGWPGGWRGQEPPELIDKGISVWQPPISIPAMFEQFFKALFQKGKPFIMFVDELSSLGGEDVPLGRVGRYPPHYGILLKQGRAAGMSIITLTQEAAYIPRQVIGQATHMVRFRLLNENDARQADRVLGRINRADKQNDESGEPVHRFGFYYARLDTPPITAHYYEGLDHFF